MAGARKVGIAGISWVLSEPAEPGMTEQQARELLRRANRGRRWWMVPTLWPRGRAAQERLQQAALAGNMTALLVLAGPGPLPDPRLSTAWTEWFRRHYEVRVLLHHLLRGHSPLSQEPAVSDPLGIIAMRPGEHELTDDMRPGIAVAAALTGHPVAGIARRKILAAGDQDVVDDVCELARDVPALAEFCLRHDLVPADPTRAACFLLLHGRYARYRAADPDGSLALEAYAGADAATRPRLASAVVDGGLFDLLHRITASGGEARTALLSGKPLAELCASLARHERWAQLWRHVIELPVADAVRQIGRFPPQWRPERAAERPLYAELRAAPAGAVAAAAADPQLLTTVELRAAKLIGLGRSRAAAIIRRSAGRRRSRDSDPLYLERYALPSGELLSRRPYDEPTYPVLVVPCEGGTVVAGEPASLWRYTDDDRTRIYGGCVGHLVATAGGWAATSATDLLIGSAQGELTHRVPLSDLGLAPGRSRWERPVDQLVVSADGTRLAFAGGGRVVVTDQNGRLLAAGRPEAEQPGQVSRGFEREPTAPVEALGFLGDALITASRARTVRRENKADVVEYGDRDWQEVTVHDSWSLVCWTVAPNGGLARGRRFWRVWHFTARYENEDREDTRHPDWVDWRLTVEELPCCPSGLLLTGVEGSTSDSDPRRAPVTRDRVRTAQVVLAQDPARYDALPAMSPAIRWNEYRDVNRPTVLPGTSYLTTGAPDRDRLQLYDLRRGAVLALLGRPVADLEPADLDAVLALSGYQDDPCVRVLRARLEHRFGRTTGRP
ncbi:hypothetical protein POF50_000970 [Streptomyces sp. SL13]|uniref:Uncharacterized protein n=1 Tax=Streptantibioticus silvisoli TaxID=2705255 RepID=A0AA90KEL8_9ACTN|nr:hypothetical protein [Streptantibioticus silvisoli]MDI5967934.1 hypothetical protein [Streptantibioticus silvisoli]